MSDIILIANRDGKAIGGVPGARWAPPSTPAAYFLTAWPWVAMAHRTVAAVITIPCSAIRKT